jgi:hypothetical protein
MLRDQYFQTPYSRENTVATLVICVGKESEKCFSIYDDDSGNHIGNHYCQSGDIKQLIKSAEFWLELAKANEANNHLVDND